MLDDKQKVFFQFIKVDSENAGQDFNGKITKFSLQNQIEYLQKMALANEKQYGNNDTAIVCKEECEDAIQGVQLETPNPFRQREYLHGLQAWLEGDSAGKTLFLYTKKAALEGQKILFKDGDNYPVPCAKIQAKKDIVSASFRMDLGEEYITSLRGGIDTMVPGRILEFRKGIKEVLKLQFYSDGSCCARLGTKDEWHHQNIFLNKVDYQQAFALRVCFSNGNAKIALAGHKEEIVLLCKDLPDTIFVSGGMYPINTWSVELLEIKTVDGEKVWLSEECSKDIQKESLGIVDLPYVVGTEKNQDKVLVLEKQFYYKQDGRRQFLHCDTIDPDGEIYVNGQLLVDKTDVMSDERDITGYLQEGNNTITFRVNPRGPEILYAWHKHQDPYNGWFLGECYLEKRGDTYIQDVQIKTLSVERKIAASVQWNVQGAVTDNLRMKCFIAKDGTEELVCETDVCQAKQVCLFSFQGKTWSTQTPVLYDVICKLYQDDILVDTYIERTGFRTIEQKNGDIYVNSKKQVLKGALLMQFLPPYDEIPCSHVCPSTEQIVWQALLAKKMNCNTVRMHQLGYGTNDRRFAKIFDALGLQVIWITRLIDSVTTVCWKGCWEQKQYYLQQMKDVINSPSIIMWEGANEQYLNRNDIDIIYREFTQGVKSVDDTRLICPVSHLYYANDSYNKGCEYYQDNGLQDEYFRPVQAVKEWNDPLVIRSAHTYDWLLGYGNGWEKFRLQDWSGQPALLESKNHAYMVSEYAVIGGQNPATSPTQKQSYELGDMQSLGYYFEDEWKLSQAYQALAARYTTKYMLSKGVDGLLWCCLTGGANDMTYLKPPIDFNGYPKYAFYSLKECFQDIFCCDEGCDLIWGEKHVLQPVIFNEGENKVVDVLISVCNEFGEQVEEIVFENISVCQHKLLLTQKELVFQEEGYYSLRYEVCVKGAVNKED